MSAEGHKKSAVDWLVGFKIKTNCLVGPGYKGEVPSVGVFLSDPGPYLREFERKPPKTLNSYDDKRDQGLNHAVLAYQL